MAKSKVPAEDREKQQLLEALRKTPDGQPRLLQGAPNAEPIIKSGKPGAALADKALQEGYVEVSLGLLISLVHFARASRRSRELRARFIRDYNWSG